MKHVPLTITVINKGSSAGCIRAVDSVAGALNVDDDCEVEILVVDTGSTKEQRKKLKNQLALFPDARLICKDLCVDYRPLLEKYLPDEPGLADEFFENRSTYGGIVDFAEARNIAMDEAKHDIQIWIDCDDVLEETRPGELREAIDKTFGENIADVIVMDYLYAFDEDDGSCITTQRRERVFDRRGYYWKGECHETCIPRDEKPRPAMYVSGARFRHIDKKPHRVSDIRNYIILARAAEVQGEAGVQVDPRTIYYLGNAARGLELMKRAEKYYAAFDELSGSEDDRFNASYFRGMMALHPKVRRPLRALDCFRRSTEIKPFDPRGFFGMARAYAALQRWNESIMWYDHGRKLQMDPNQVHSFNPHDVDYHPHNLATFAYKELNRPDDAMEAAERALKARPTLQDSRDLCESIMNWRAGIKLTDAFEIICRNQRYGGALQQRRLGVQIAKEMAAIPPELERCFIGIPEGHDGREDKPEIAILAPGSIDWCAASRNVGIGGSEKMIIILSEALQRTGKVNVSVYCHCPVEARGVCADTGVRYQHYSEFDSTRPRHTAVYWRSPGVTQNLPAIAQQRVLWMHDVTYPETVKDFVPVFDHIQGQSEHHFSFLGDTVPEEQKWLSRNAIEVPTDHGLVRDPKLVVYGSSWDRGLMTACQIVAKAQETDPDIQLVVAYGINDWCRESWAKHPHCFIPDVGRDISVDVYERRLYEALDLVNAQCVHKVNFAQMEALYQSAGVWLYPTRFHEISCMSAMEAQANGAVVLATKFGALAETILPQADSLSPRLPDLPEGGPVSDEIIAESARLLVEACRVEADDGRRSTQARAAIEAYNVEDLAEIWLDRLGLNGDSAEVVEGSSRVACCGAEGSDLLLKGATDGKIE